MADIELVIKISNYDKEWITNGYCIPEEINTRIAETIANGTPLPKGHGRLKDVDWIPVSEKLPEEAKRVLVYAERGQFRKEVIDIGWQVDGRWHIDGCNGVVGIAWMPLPEPYKAK